MNLPRQSQIFFIRISVTPQIILGFQLRHIFFIRISVTPHKPGRAQRGKLYDGFLYGQKQLQKDFTKGNGRAQRGKFFTRLFTKRKAITKKFTLRAQREENISTHCTIHCWLAGTRVAGDPEIVKLCTLLRWLWFFAVILDKMQVWGTKKDALCTWCFRAPCRWQSISLDQAAAAQILGWGAGGKNSRNLVPPW